MHISVLPNEAIGFLNPLEGKVIMDATLGCGGHSYQIAKMVGASGKLIGIDCDDTALRISSEKLKDFK